MGDNTRTHGDALIAAERARQIHVKGYTPEHDAAHDLKDLIEAGIAYAAHAAGSEEVAPYWWPWDREEWKPSPDKVRCLVKAGALIAAAIDRAQAGGL